MRDLTQLAQRDPPYVRETVRMRFGTERYCLGRNEGIPGNLVPQSPHIGPLAFFETIAPTSLPPGVFTGRILLDLVRYAHRRR